MIVPIIEHGEELCIRVSYSSFFFVFQAKSGTSNNLRNGSKMICQTKDLSFVIRIRTIPKKIKKLSQFREKLVQVFDF